MNFPKNEANRLIDMALEEDLGSGDVSANWTIPEDKQSQAELRVKAEGVLAGIDFIRLVCQRVDPSIQVETFYSDSDSVHDGDIIAKLSGSARSLLAAERTFLNFLQHLSGVATQTAEMVRAIAPGSATKILDTRKTLPGYRLLQKYAVLQGGGTNHRMGLYDMVMLKENHIEAAGGIRSALEKVFDAKPTEMKVEVEIESLDQIDAALSQNIYQVMLDNMDCETMIEGVRLLKHIRPDVKVEASGNMTLERIPDVSQTGVDFISIGALTHSVSAFDISLRFL